MTGVVNTLGLVGEGLVLDGEGLDGGVGVVLLGLGLGFGHLGVGGRGVGRDA